MASLCFYGRRALRRESHRLMPLLNLHLSNLTEIVRYYGEGRVEEEIRDVLMGDAEAEADDPLTSAFKNLRVSE